MTKTRIGKVVCLSVIGLGAVYLLTGCQPDKIYYDAANSMMSSMGQEYTNYVKNDANLTENQKRIRYENVESFIKATKERTNDK